MRGKGYLNDLYASMDNTKDEFFFSSVAPVSPEEKDEVELLEKKFHKLAKFLLINMLVDSIYYSFIHL